MSDYQEVPQQVNSQNIALDNISPDDFERFILGDGNRGSSSARWISGSIRCYLRYRQLLGDDVSHLMRAMLTLARANPPALPEVLTDAEVAALLNVFRGDFPRRR